jgi:hypothetical protein
VRKTTQSRWLVTLPLGLTALLLMGVSLPLWQGRVPPNTMNGFRSAKTLADPALWYRVNAVMGAELFVLGAVLLALVALCHVTLSIKRPALAALGIVGLMVLGAAASAWHCGLMG